MTQLCGNDVDHSTLSQRVPLGQRCTQVVASSKNCVHVRTFYFVVILLRTTSTKYLIYALAAGVKRKNTLSCALTS